MKRTKSRDPQTKNLYTGLVHSYVEAFINERRSRGLAAGTIQSYLTELNLWLKWLDKKELIALDDITTDSIRQYLTELGTHRNNGGVHSAYKVIRCFLNWYDTEFELDWKNPITKVKAPPPSRQALPGVPLDDIQAMIAQCTTRLDKRDKAILLFLLDTGVRAGELIALNLGDIHLISGAVVIQHGKGNKRRTVYAGRTVLKLLRAYLKTRPDLKTSSALFVMDDGQRFNYYALKDMVYRRADWAHVPRPGLHDFRRAFALQCLRNGMDLITLSRLLGHGSVAVTQRYLALIDEDLATGHRLASPVDNWKL